MSSAFLLARCTELALSDGLQGAAHESPKVSLRALIFRSYNSVARLSPRLREKIYMPLRESTCITARVSWGWGRIDCTID